MLGKTYFNGHVINNFYKLDARPDDITHAMARVEIERIINGLAVLILSNQHGIKRRRTHLRKLSMYQLTSGYQYLSGRAPYIADFEQQS